MLTINEQVAIDAKPILPEGLAPEECLYFDIETTGLSADTSSLYLISALLQEGGTWTLTQLFADDCLFHFLFPPNGYWSAVLT